MTDSYNGWTNRETWAVHLHLSNDEGLWTEALDQARAAQESATDRYQPAYEVAQVLKDWVTELLDADYWTAELMSPIPPGWRAMPDWVWSMLQDIGDPDRIDWQEVAEAALEALQEDT